MCLVRFAHCDYCFSANMSYVIGMFPGPLVEANTGDRIVVKVTNNMANGTAIHWHGMFQNGKAIVIIIVVVFLSNIIGHVH